MARLFNQKLDKWDTGKVTNMRYMFSFTNEFNNRGVPLTLDTMSSY